MSKKTLPYFDDYGNLKNTHHFSKAAQRKMTEGHYCPYSAKNNPTKFRDFWKEEIRKCYEGVKIGEIYIPGLFYFFLNYHPIDVIDKNGDLTRGFPGFWLIHWQIFRILQYCKEKGLHFGCLKVRGCGFSEIGSAIGAHTYAIRPLYFKIFHNKNVTESSKAFYFAALDQYLTSGDGIVTKCFSNIDFLNQKTDGALKHLDQIKFKNSERIGGFKTKGGDKIRTGGQIKGAIVDRPDKVRGSRTIYSLLEEAGAFPKVDAAVNIMRPLVERGGKVTGTIIAWGTSNEDPKGIQGLTKIMNNPQAFRMVKFRNVWTKENGEPIPKDQLKYIPKDPLEFVIDPDTPEYRESGNGTGWFIPAYDALFTKFDKDGNPQREEAYEFYEKERELVLSGDSIESEDTSTAMAYIADHPFTIKEALLVSHDAEFNSPKLSRQRVNIETRRIEPHIERGNFFAKKVNGEIQAIEWEKDPKGKFLIHQHPEWSDDKGHYKTVSLNDPLRDNNVYIAGIDSIDQGKKDSSGSGSSLACLVKKRVGVEGPMGDPTNNTYVAMYLNRPDDVRDAYDDVMLMLLYFNAKALLEYTKLRIISYFEEKKYAWLFAREPENPAVVIHSYKKRKYKRGIRMTNDIIDYYVSLIKEYLEDYSENIYFVELLKQLSEFTIEKKTKFDLVVAMGLCEILDQEYRGVLPSSQVEKKTPTRMPSFYKDANGVKKFGIKEENRDILYSKSYLEKLTEPPYTIHKGKKVYYD